MQARPLLFVQLPLLNCLKGRGGQKLVFLISRLFFRILNFPFLIPSFPSLPYLQGTGVGTYCIKLILPKKQCFSNAAPSTLSRLFPVAGAPGSYYAPAVFSILASGVGHSESDSVHARLGLPRPHQFSVFQTSCHFLRPQACSCMWWEFCWNLDDFSTSGNTRLMCGFISSLC